MNYPRKNQKRTPLFVKEIIFPNEKEFEIKSSGIAYNHLKNGMEEHLGNILNSSVKIGDHEVRSVGELKILEKKPLENYFGGTVGKKQAKKKIRHQKVTHSLRELFCNELQTKSNGEEIPFVNKQFFKEKESVEKDENIERKKVQHKIDKFEKMRECRNRNSYMKQRQAEEKYIEQQENLAETWCEFMKRRKQLREFNSNDILTYQKSLCREIYKDYNRFCISIISRKFWNDDQADKSSKKPKEDNEEGMEGYSEPISDKSMLDDLEGKFLEKLVFVDDEDTDDFDYRGRNFRPDKYLN